MEDEIVIQNEKPKSVQNVEIDLALHILFLTKNRDNPVSKTTWKAKGHLDFGMQ